MKTPALFKTTFVFIIAGILFSGYLSAVNLFSDTCAFNESCPYFLGYPACWYGFAMYFVMFVATLLALFGATSLKKTVSINTLVSFLGIIFAGSFAIDEVMSGQATGVLGLSTCMYGLIFYILIFIFSLITKERQSSLVAN